MYINIYVYRGLHCKGIYPSKCFRARKPKHTIKGLFASWKPEESGNMFIMYGFYCLRLRSPSLYTEDSSKWWPFRCVSGTKLQIPFFFSSHFRLDQPTLISTSTTRAPPTVHPCMLATWCCSDGPNVAQKDAILRPRIRNCLRRGQKTRVQRAQVSRWLEVHHSSVLYERSKFSFSQKLIGRRDSSLGGHSRHTAKYSQGCIEVGNVWFT